MVHRPRLAIGHRAGDPTALLPVFGGDGYVAVDWTVGPDVPRERLAGDWSALASRCAAYGMDLEIRIHTAPVTVFDVAQPDQGGRADAARRLHRLIEDAATLNAGFITTHVAGVQTMMGGDVDIDAAAEELAALNRLARDRGIVLSVENLKSGPTADIATIAALVEATGVAVTFDVGHATSSRPVRLGETTVPEMVQMVGESIVAAHIYEGEDATHLAPEDLSIIGNALEVLAFTPCGWWVVELFDMSDVEATRTLLKGFLDIPIFAQEHRRDRTKST